MPLIVRAGKKSEVTSPERRAALENLRDRLGASGPEVVLEITDYVPGYRGLGFAEAVGIYIGLRASEAVIDRLANDIFDRARDWARARFKRKAQDSPTGFARPESFTIYGPDGETLKTWKVDREGEHES